MRAHPWDSPGKNTGKGCHFLLQCIKVKSESEVTQSCPTLRNPMYSSLPGSSIHGIFQARVLEWSAIAFSGGICLSQHKSFLTFLKSLLNLLQYCFYFMFGFLSCEAFGILVDQIHSPYIGRQSLNHCIAREVPSTKSWMGRKNLNPHLWNPNLFSTTKSFQTFTEEAVYHLFRDFFSLICWQHIHGCNLKGKTKKRNNMK